MRIQAKRSLATLSILALCAGASLSFPVAHAGSSAGSPKAVCNELVVAAKKDDFQAFRDLSLNWETHETEKAEKRRSKKEESEVRSAHQSHLSQLKDLSCGAEHIAGDHAMVEAESQGQKRLIPFVQVKGQWKFDAWTYMSFYPMHHEREAHS